MQGETSWSIELRKDASINGTCIYKRGDMVDQLKKEGLVKVQFTLD